MLKFFYFQYLGYEEVKEARGVKVCSVAVAKLIKDKKNVSFQIQYLSFLMEFDMIEQYDPSMICVTI